MERGVDIREWTAGKRTKKGITWKSLAEQIPYVDEALENRNASQGKCILYRRRRQRMSGRSSIPEARRHTGVHKKNICLRPTEYKRLKELLSEIGINLPELDAVLLL